MADSVFFKTASHCVLPGWAFLMKQQKAMSTALHASSDVFKQSTARKHEGGLGFSRAAKQDKPPPSCGSTDMPMSRF